MERDAIRMAASVVAARDGDDGLEVLVLERSAASRFLPGYVAFPGGAVDDHDAVLAGRWFGDTEEAPRAAAVRELAEEVGLALTDGGVVPIGGTDRPLAAIDAAPPLTSQLNEIAHWVAPEDVPVRFDARYFAFRAPSGVEPVPDMTETADAWWTSPHRLVAEWENGRRKLYWPTWYTVSLLVQCRSVLDVLALRIETREPNDDELERIPRSVFWQD
jgi:8-oxo-dGTP pyrophosphatase MutT (NUDIX family)